MPINNLIPVIIAFFIAAGVGITGLLLTYQFLKIQRVSKQAANWLKTSREIVTSSVKGGTSQGKGFISGQELPA